MEVIIGNDMGLNPASVDLDTDVARVNASLFERLSAFERRLVLLHEAGHVFLDSVDNEELADRFAIEVLAGGEQESLRKCVTGLIGILEACGVPDKRLTAIVRTALEIDYKRFGNEHAAMLLAELDGRCANMAAAVVAAIISAAVTVTELCVEHLLGRRAEWFQGDNRGIRKTSYRVEAVRLCTRIACAEIVENYCIEGEQAVLARMDNKSRMYGLVHWNLVAYLTDKSMFTRSFRNSDNFYKEKNCGWAKQVIDEEVAVQRQWAHKLFVDAGLSTEKNLNNGNSRLWIVLIGLLVISYLLWQK